jgi:hypothetical protein
MPGDCKRRFLASKGIALGLILVICTLCASIITLPEQCISAENTMRRPYTLPVVTSQMKREAEAKQSRHAVNAAKTGKGAVVKSSRKGKGKSDTVAAVKHAPGKSTAARAGKSKTVKSKVGAEKKVAGKKDAAKARPRKQPSRDKTLAANRPNVRHTNKTTARPTAVTRPAPSAKQTGKATAKPSRTIARAEKQTRPDAMARQPVPVAPLVTTISGLPLRPAHHTGRAASGLAGFTDNPFHLKYRDSASAASRKAKRLAELKRGGQAKEKSRLSLAAKSDTPPNNRLVPYHGAPFSGGTQTLPYMDRKPKTELSMAYKVSKKTTTRVVVNPQDSASPIYRPLEPDEKMNSGGMYMDLDIVKNLQLTMGGEYSEVENNKRLYGEPKVSQGATVGLKYSF